jgi:alkanesulfonate monooxygenase SsuD/methylene tetrahydromethanopterin reductase-like flavin-dependent oxidoreductase (luciferase family)
MQYGVFLLMSRRDLGLLPAEVIAQGVEQAVAAEEMGFSDVWIAEHHFSNFGMVPAPLYLAVTIAERTRRVRIAPAVLVLPFYQPLRVAEEVALVDVLTGGRLMVGIGRGYQPYEFDRFGLSIEDSRALFEENVEIMHRALTRTTFSYRGSRFDIPETSLQVRPIQQPHPPFWVAAYTPDTLALTARHGFGLLTQYGFRPVEFVHGVRRAYDEQLRAAGRRPEEGKLALVLYAYVADDRTDALDWVEHGLWTFRLSDRLRNGQEIVCDGVAEAAPVANEPSPEALLERLIVGDAETCIARIQRLVDALRPTSLVLDVAFGSMTHQRVLRAMRRLAEEVMPHVRAPAAVPS